MFRNKVRCKTRHIGCVCIALSSGEASGIGLAFGRAQMYLRAEIKRQVILHVASLDEAHGESICSVGWPEDARLERSLECRRREGRNGLLT